MTFWFNDPTILLQKDKITDIWPGYNDNLTDQLNSISRFIIFLVLFSYIFLKHRVIILFGIIILGLIVLYYKYKKSKEGFLNLPLQHNINNSVLESNNPLGNVLMNDYVDQPQKKDSIEKIQLDSDPRYGKTKSFETKYDETIENDINQKTKDFIYQHNSDNKDIDKLFKSLGDNINFDKQMRQFHTTPNTTIPNDQSSFLTYCYGNLPSDKNVISY
jgi:hypothetical protein